MSEPDLSLEEAQGVVSTKEHPRVTEESIEARIHHVRYIHDGTGTFCIITMINGFATNGYSKPADERNYDRDVGERYSYENAFRNLWQLEGYLLCEKLSQGAEMIMSAKAQATVDINDLRPGPLVQVVNDGVPELVTDVEGGEWYEPDQLLHAIQFSDGRIWDTVNGWRAAYSREPVLESARNIRQLDDKPIPVQTMNPNGPFPPGLVEYRSHKIVRAGQIVSAKRQPRSDDQFKTGPTDGLLELGSGWKVMVDDEYIEKRVPAGILHNAVGGYYIVYADGFESWSPAEAFETGYQLVESN